MPYKDIEQRRDKTRDRVRQFREREKALRGVTQGVTVDDVTPTFDALKAKFDVRQGNHKPVKPHVIPVYNQYVHRAGDRVLVKGIETVIPELDAEGQPVPTFT